MTFKSVKADIIELLKISVPVILGQMSIVLMGITDMVMLGDVGKTEVAAVGLANQIYFLFMVMGSGTLAVITPMIASSKGAQNKLECGEILRTGIELSFIISIALSVFLILIGENFYIFRQPEEIEDVSKIYLRILTLSTVPLMLFFALKQYTDGLSMTKPPMVITIIAVLLKAFLNWIFIYGQFSFPPMDAKGAALATLICRIFMALALVVYIFNNKKYEKFLPHLISRFNTFPLIVKILRIGIPGGFQMFFEMGAFAATAVFVGWIGTNELAAHQIALALAALTYTCSVGLSLTGTIKVAHAFGEGDNKGIIKWSKISLFAILIFMFMCFVLISIFRENFAAFFIDESSVIKIASSVLLLAGLFQISDGLQLLGLSMLRSVNDVNLPTVITLFSYWALGLPASYLIGIYAGYGLMGIWVGLFLGITVSAILLFIRFYFLLNNGKLQKYSAINFEPEQ
jgi:MATE family multidrug resistance protein